MAQRILYILVPDSHISPFDVTLAADAGFTQVLPFVNVNAEDVVSIVQSAIFSRPAKRFNDTGIFLGGRDAHLATDMYQNAKNPWLENLKLAYLQIRMVPTQPRPVLLP